MSDIPTLDPNIVIESRVAEQTVYRRISDGARWQVSGTCNQCGLCAIGAVGEWYQWVGPPGTPGASIDTRVPSRLDDPVLPGFIEDMEQMAAITPTATVNGCSFTITEL